MSIIYKIPAWFGFAEFNSKLGVSVCQNVLMKKSISIKIAGESVIFSIAFTLHRGFAVIASSCGNFYLACWSLLFSENASLKDSLQFLNLRFDPACVELSSCSIGFCRSSDDCKLFVSTVNDGPFDNENMNNFLYFGLQTATTRDFAATRNSLDCPILLACTDSRAYLVLRDQVRNPKTSDDVISYNVLTVDTRTTTAELWARLSTFAPLHPSSSPLKLCCGKDHAVMLCTGGHVYTTGNGMRGELGVGQLKHTDSWLLVELLESLDVCDIAVGGWHNIALTTAGDAYIWGWNEACQCGIEDYNVIQEPLLVELPGYEDANIYRVACGSRHTVCLNREGEVFVCGWNKYGQTGEGQLKIWHKLMRSGGELSGSIVDVLASGWSTFQVYSDDQKDVT